MLIFVFLASFSFGESLWQGENRGLFNDHKAKGIGDSLTIIIEEKISNKQKNDNSMSNSNAVGIGPGGGMTSFLGTSQTKLPAASSFEAGGEQSTEGEFKTNVTVRVREIMANGELFVSGNKVTVINGEEQFIEISGIVRPENIIEGNKVYSTDLADARLKYEQNGEIKNVIAPGFLTKFFNSVF